MKKIANINLLALCLLELSFIKYCITYKFESKILLSFHKYQLKLANSPRQLYLYLKIKNKKSKQKINSKGYTVLQIVDFVDFHIKKNRLTLE
jgi:hypothetical protein